jgi:hypothetical protein
MALKKKLLGTAGAIPTDKSLGVPVVGLAHLHCFSLLGLFVQAGWMGSTQWRS